MTIIRCDNRAHALRIQARLDGLIGHDADGWFIVVPGLRHPAE